MVAYIANKEILAIQVMKFLLVGSFTFMVDYTLMIICIEILNFDYLYGTALGFVFGSALNYYLSIKCVFSNGKYQNLRTELFVFMLFTLLGLLLNHLIMYSGCDLMKMDYRFIKIVSLVLITTFNFLTKKIFVFVE